MKNKSIVLIIVFILSLFKVGYAQRKSDMGIGKVDLYTVILLHPSMIDFNPEIQAFSVQRDAYSMKKAEDEQNNNKEEVLKLEKQIKVIKSRIIEEDKKFMNKMDNLTKQHYDELSDLATGPAAMSEVEYKKKKDKEESEYFSKISHLNGEISIIEEQLNKLNKFSYYSDYTTPNETEKRIDAIINEVNTYIRRIAEQKGISVVLNSGYKRMMKQYAANKREGSGFIANAQSFGSIFKTPVNYSDLSEDTLALKGYYESINSRINSWLTDGAFILERKINYLANCDIIMGGQDLTGEVLSSLYKAYKLDSNISHAIIQNVISY